MIKLKPCKECGKDSYIFSRGRCKNCSQKGYVKKETTTPQTEKNKAKRKTERAGFGEFFRENVEYIQQNNISCENCGVRLNGNISEVAHIISKSRNKEVATNKYNRVFLCSQFTDNTNFCHEKFDNGLSGRLEMKVFGTAFERYKEFDHLIEVVSKEVLQFKDILDGSF